MLLNVFLRLNKIHVRKKSILASCLKYKQFGEPAEVLEIQQEEVTDPVNDEVLVNIIASPINPADINTIQGKYPVKPQFPAVGGNECVAEVAAIGPNVTKFKISDRVIPFATGLGTWRTHAKFTEKNLLKIPKNIDIASAATITVNPCTAYRMLKDFRDLKADDVIIQNGANSGVGQAVHQLCNAWGIKSVGVVRDRPDVENLKRYLKDIGATEVLTEEELRKTDIFKNVLKKPKLGFNCVGGKSATEVIRHLANKATLVTYGGMSREPLTVSTATLIFKDISFYGFWMTRWSEENFDNPKRKEMLNEICNLLELKKIKAPIHQIIPLKEFKTAMSEAMAFKGFTGKKFILSFSDK
ncbi:enoyl-[acyl-carrier-protein] reductase, mitochondrial [Condylostylus longicornis]|uniref:enoyl-[acyl-carrier-protein] reductase, mitochondrial n=1 Tax=Condylostylus longicornis TaxID=2530218 RepID=UPI00244DF9DC|nr:enoyl-[acyl-carrier-protein] reductase, mitochondrial [Condylostylus longicornis]